MQYIKQQFAILIHTKKNVLITEMYNSGKKTLYLEIRIQIQFHEKNNFSIRAKFFRNFLRFRYFAWFCLYLRRKKKQIFYIAKIILTNPTTTTKNINRSFDCAKLFFVGELHRMNHDFSIRFAYLYVNKISPLPF